MNKQMDKKKSFLFQSGIKQMITKEWIHDHLNDMIAYSGLIFCFLIFTILAKVIKDVNMLDTSGLAFKSILRDGVIYSVLSIGAVFVYSLGSKDISVGAQISLYSLILIYVYNKNGSTVGSIVLGFFIILVISMVCGAINSVLAVVLKIKSVISSLVLQVTLKGITALLFIAWNPNSEAMAFVSGVASTTYFGIFRESWMQVLILVVLVLIYSFLFNYTKIGKYTKAAGANSICARHAGVNITKYRMLAYVVFALSISIATVIYVACNGSTTTEAGNGYEMKVMICIILGGMPLEGGMKSKISSAVVGAFTYALISRSFVYLGVPDNFTLLFIAFIYILVVSITCRSNALTLPR